jgi:hypothetical protein
VDAGFLWALREDWLSRLDRFRIRIPYLLDNILQLMHLKYDAGRPSGQQNRQRNGLFGNRFAYTTNGTPLPEKPFR